MAGAFFPAIAVDRLRMGTDGEGVTTLVAAYGCPLRCKYCINPRSWEKGTKVKNFTPQSLLERVKIDNLYFIATGGGVTFGGGEPLLYIDFIEEFRRICPKEWKINIETCLNVPEESAIRAAKAADRLIVDIKDMNDHIYRAYTGKDNARVKENLSAVLDIMGEDGVIVRIPHIKGYNTPDDVENSINGIKEVGAEGIDVFYYKIKENV